MKREIESTMLLIYDYISIKYPNVLVKEEPMFIGCKFEPSQYFIFFVSIHEGIMKLTYREDYTNKDVKRVNIEKFSDSDIISLIENIMIKASSIKQPSSKSLIENDKHLDEKQLDSTTSLYNIKNIIDVKSMSLNKQYIENKYSEITIDSLLLSIRTYNCLKNNYYYTLADIINTPLKKLSKIRFMGKKSMKELIDLKIKILIDEGVLDSSTIDSKFLDNYQDFKNINCSMLNISKALKTFCYENNVETVGELIGLEDNIENDLKNEIEELKSVYNLGLEAFFSKYLESTINPLSEEPIDIETLMNISESQYEKYLDFGLKVGEVINDYFSKMIHPRSADILRYRFNIIDNENNSLRAIASIVGISPERVRQIIEKELRKMRTAKFKRHYLGKIINMINDIEGIEILNYYICGVMNVYNKMFLKLLLDLIDLSYSQKVFDKIDELEKLLVVEQKKEPLMLKADYIIQKIKFPNSAKNNNRLFDNLATMRRVNENNNIGSVYLDSINKNIKYESYSEKKILELLDLFEDIKDIKSQSIALSYDFDGKSHKYYPDFQVLFKDGKMAIIEVKDLFHMGEAVVKEKYKALVKYCEQNGIGYLMIDERMNDYESIKSNYYDSQKDSIITDYLVNHGPVKYGDFLEFKNTTNFDTMTLISILVNNDNIKMTRSPFKIDLNK